MQVLLAHPGTQHAFRLAHELERRGLLGEFWTGLALGESSPAARLAGWVRGWPLVGGLHSRVARGLPRSRLQTQPGGELAALLWMRLGGDKLSALHERNRRFQEAIPEAAIRRNNSVIAFDTSAWLLARRARDHDRPLWLDRSIACVSAVAPTLAELHRRYPEWQPAPQERPEWLTAAERQEHHLAHRIVVGGSFARDSLLAEGVDGAKVRVNPYGVDWARFQQLAPTAERDRPLRFLFVGSVIGRKGVPVLLEAWRRLAPGDAELWLAGMCGRRERALIPGLPGLRVLGRVPHADIPQLYAQADVFVLPSLLEGFGLVLLEALASGLPIIATPNTGGIDLLASPALGRLVPPNSVEGLADAMRHYLAQPPSRAQVIAAVAPLRPRFSWEAYGDRWAVMLNETASQS